MLDRVVGERILKTCQQLSEDGKVLSHSQLHKCYDLFRSRFGPQALAALDGEALLEAMHDHGTMDSLVYWLEFKNDEQFPAKFGSIAGGSALKFGIFRRKETGAWNGRGPQNYPVEISTEEAIGIARKHRDQLIAGSELLSQMPSNGSDDDYRMLQEQMDQLAPDVSNLAWGHKYFHMLAPDKLDDYHSPEYQRFHLFKLLQTPPLGDGRYIVAGRYVAVAAELGLRMNHLTTTLNHLDGRPYKCWRIGTRSGLDNRSRWDAMREGSYVAVGWDELNDLSGIKRNADSKENLRRLVARHYPQSPQAIGRNTQQLFNFVAAIQEGDLVVACDGGSVLGIGRVVGPYYFNPQGVDFRHHRPVEWLNLDAYELPSPEGLRTTVHEFRKHPQNIVEFETRILGARPAPGARAKGTSVRSVQLPRMLGQVQSVLERKKQVILYGPPGTGKTYWAEQAALELAAIHNYDIRFGDLSDEIADSLRSSTETPDSYVRTCCFHPAYGYEDFLEGFRPRLINDQMVFRLEDGIFKKICQHAADSPEKRFYLIIDEINRGDIPRIFGELLTVIENNKRGKSILLPLSSKPFEVPPNVYVIGTMNTADRSIALLDAALRRRFGFIEVMPDSSILSDMSVEGIPLGPWLDAMNSRICEGLGVDARNLQIGHSFLLQGGNPISDFATLSRTMREEIIPLIEEYCYEDFSLVEKILGSRIVDQGTQAIRTELFDAGNEQDLVQALLAPSPHISMTKEAAKSDEAQQSLQDQYDSEEDEEEIAGT